MDSLGDGMCLVDSFQLVHRLHDVCLDGLLTDAQEIAGFGGTPAASGPSKNVALTVCEMAEAAGPGCED